MDKAVKIKTRKKIDSDTMPHSLRKGKNVFCYTLISLAVFHFIVFYCLVNVNSILLAFKKYVGLDEFFNPVYEYTFDNFAMLFKEFSSANSELWGSLKNTLLFFSLTFVLMPGCFFVAYFMSRKIWGYRVFRVVFFLPSIISSVVLVVLFKSFIAVGGPLQHMLGWFGDVSNYPDFLTNDKYAKWVIVVYCLWTGFGVNVILYQGAISRVPDTVVEAGKLDGVGIGREMFHIIIPMIWPTLSTTAILAMTGIFTASGPNMLFVDPSGDQFDTMTLSYWIFHSVQGGSYEYPSAVGLFFTFIGLPIVFGTRKLLNKAYDDVEY